MKGLEKSGLLSTEQYKKIKALGSRPETLFGLRKLSSITFNEFTVKDSFAFAEEIVPQDSKHLMGRLDIYSFFTNIPLEETINICTNMYQFSL